jgi:hypothetical protein
MAVAKGNPFGGATELEDRRRRRLRRALTDSSISASDLGLRYLSLGGPAGKSEVDAYIQSLYSLPPAPAGPARHPGRDLRWRPGRVIARY